MLNYISIYTLFNITFVISPKIPVLKTNNRLKTYIYNIFTTINICFIILFQIMSYYRNMLFIILSTHYKCTIVNKFVSCDNNYLPLYFFSILLTYYYNIYIYIYIYSCLTSISYIVHLHITSMKLDINLNKHIHSKIIRKYIYIVYKN